MDKVIKSYIGKGMTYARDNATGKALAWHRDIGNCWHLLLAEATECTAQAVGPEDAESMEILDTIVKTYICIYKDSTKDNLQGLAKFEPLYSYLQDKGKQGDYVYATFTSFFMQSFFCFMFTSREMAMGLPQEVDERILEHSCLLNILGLMDDQTRVDTMNALVMKGLWTSKVDHSRLLRRLDDFMAIIKEQQAKQVEEQDG
jgi:hypothetical protein